MPPQLDHPFEVDRLNGVDDYMPECDVPTLGKSFTDAFSKEIDGVRADPRTLPTRKVHVLLGPAGYGKTHLLGRIHHHQRERVYFVFVPAITGLDAADKVLQLEATLRWRVVEALLNSTTEFAPFRLQLAKLLAPSFRSYFDQLGAKVRERCGVLRAELTQGDPLAVLGLFGTVEAIGAYHLLADAIHQRLPHLSGAVLRALVLGCSPVADEARWWLRGEGDQLPQGRAAALRLPEQSPPVVDVLIAVAEILRLNKVPLALCFDQLDELFKDDAAGFTALTGQLMSWLQTVPNLMIGAGFIKDSWKLIVGQAGFKAFIDRTVEHHLPELSGDDAVALVERRLALWTDFDPTKPKGWPFELDSVRAFAERHQPSPRSFIQVDCKPRFDEWEGRKRQGLISFGSKPPQLTPEELFRNEWAKQLDKARGGKKAGDFQEIDLWTGVELALGVARNTAHLPAGIRIESLQKQPITPSTATNPKPSVRIVFAGGRSVIVTVSKRVGGVAFGQSYSALNDAHTKKDVGAVVVWSQEKLTVGPGTANFLAYKKRVDEKTIRPFPLDVEEATFHQLETLRQMMQDAKSGTLFLGANTVGPDECRELVIQTGLIANLKLFDFVFKDWPGLAPAATVPPVLPPPPPPPTAMATPTKSTTATLFPDPPAVVPTPPLVAPVPATPPAAPVLPEWVDVMLKKATEYLKKKGQPVQPAGAVVGPTFVRLKVEPRGDTDSSKVKRQAENLKVHLGLGEEPLILTQPGYYSIDVPRPDRQTVLLPPLLADAPPKLAGEPAFPVGVGVDGTVEWLNLSDPEGCHLLVAGTTGSGKSEFLKAALAALAARLQPTQVKFRLIDPKRVTFNVPPHCPYLGGPVVYDGEEALPVLDECVQEMERRYTLMQQRGVDHARHLTGADAVPRWVVVMDEFADLMTNKAMKKELEPLLQRLGAKARAAGIHLILGTQRPSADVVTPLLRANLPGKIGLMVGSERESNLFLDAPDAAYLFGKGDLVWKRGGGLVRLQSPFVPKDEFNRLLRVS